MAQFQDLRLAVLVDADNIPKKCIKAVMEELAVYGTPTIKRIYGDWTSQQLSNMKQLLLECALTPVQQYAYTVGKNSTDSAMIIDAMDILYSGNVDGFCLVSSDSDFTRLATRLREAGMKVIGVGEKKTPMPFIVACDKFIYVEVIKTAKEEEAKQDKAKQTKNTSKTAKKDTAKPAEPQPEQKKRHVPENVVELIADSVAAIAGEDGFASLSDLGNLLIKKQPDFDPRNFGFSKLTNLVKSQSRFELDVRPDNNYVRDSLAESDDE